MSLPPGTRKKLNLILAANDRVKRNATNLTKLSENNLRRRGRILDGVATSTAAATWVLEAYPPDYTLTGRADPASNPHTDMLKMGDDYIKAPARLGKGPGYSRYMTLAALHMPSKDFDTMLAMMNERKYGSCVFYIRSGSNMKNVFSRNDFDFWGDHARIIDRCERMLAAGVAPCPVLMSNDDKSFNGNWSGNLMPKITKLLDDIHTRRGLVDRAMQAIEIDKSFGNFRRPPHQPERDFFGVRQVRDTLGGHVDTGALKTVRYPEITWIGHMASNWAVEENLGEAAINANYVGPTIAGMNPHDKMWPWYDVIYHQPNPRWGRYTDPEKLLKQQVTSWKQAATLIQKDGAVPIPFEYAQLPWCTEEVAKTIGSALVKESMRMGLGDGYGTGA